jgi:hypothetical protein
MNELLNDTRFWLVTLGAAVVGFVRYLWNKQERRLEKLEADSVRRAEFDQFRADLREEHEENSGRLDRIETGITGTHKRLDDLYRDLIAKSGQR